MGNIAPGPEGPRGPQGLQGPAGPIGPKGDPGTVGWNDFTDVQKDELINRLKTDAAFKGVKGDKGEPGETTPEILQELLKPKTLWCTTGEICELPAEKSTIKGARYKDIVLQPDAQKEVKIESGMLVKGDLNVDNLVTTNNATINTLTKVKDIEISGDLKLHDGWRINTSNGHLRIFKGTTQKMVIHHGDSEKRLWYNEGVAGQGEYLNDKYVTSGPATESTPSA